MNDEDLELERLKAKRLAEMQKNFSMKQQTKEQSESKPEQTNHSRDILVSKLGYRGLEVLQNAESQFPKETQFVVEKIAELLESGEIIEKLDGGKLLLLFRTVGLNIRMQTKINIEQDGKFVSLSEKLGTTQEDEQ